MKWLFKRGLDRIMTRITWALQASIGSAIELARAVVTLFQKLGKCVAWDRHTVLLGLVSSDLSMAFGTKITSGVALGGASAAKPKRGLARRK